MGSNTLTLADIASASQPHGVGEVWAVTLWDRYWNFVHTYGFDHDLMSGPGGNNRAIGLVIDALKLQPCNPNFVQARDAILQADLNESDGENQCLI